MSEIEIETVASVWNMRCPHCGSDDDIRVQGVCWMSLFADGTDPTDSDHEWDANSRAYCRHCDFEGSVNDFEIREAERVKCPSCLIPTIKNREGLTPADMLCLACSDKEED